MKNLFCLALLFIIGHSAPAGALSVSPTPSFSFHIEETSGIPRYFEPTQVSLPFAQGMLKEPNTISISDSSGQAIPFQAEVLARWDDNSIRWFLIRFLASIPTNGTADFRVNIVADNPIPSESPMARQEGSTWIVNTGPISAMIGAEHNGTFAITDKEGNRLFTQIPRLTVYSPTGQEHRCAPPDRIQVEENGPLYTSVFLSGPMIAEDTQYNGLFQYETRFHFWRGLPRVLAEHTVIAARGAEKGITIVDGIVVDMKLEAAFSNYAIGTEQDCYSGDLSPSDSVYLKQNCAYWHECTQGSDPQVEPVKYVVLESDFSYGIVDQEGRELQKGEKASGSLMATADNRSFGIAVRDFWEEGPKGLRVAGDGSVAVECYAHWTPQPGESRPERIRTPDFSTHPRLSAWAEAANTSPEDRIRLWLKETGYSGPVRRGPFRFGEGRAITTDVLYSFGENSNTQPDISILQAFRYPLIPVVDPKYVASTHAFPFINLAAAESGLPVFEKGLKDLFDNWKIHAIRYGFLHFGDDQCAWGYNGTVPATTDDQEYDTTQCLTMQFVRTGDPEYLRWAKICARHFIDVDQVHPSGKLHYHGYTSGGDYHEENVGCDMGGHPYIGGIVNHYLLTGDRRSLRGIQRLAHALADYGSNARELILTTDGRSLSRAGVCLAAIYDLTRNPAHLEPVHKMVDTINHLSGDVTNDLRGESPFGMWWLNHSEMCYHVRELLVRYHVATGDERTLATLKMALDLYIHDLWDNQEEAWRGFLGAPHDFNMPYEQPVVREGRNMYTKTGYAAAEIGFSFAYLAAITGDHSYLAPFLDYLDDLGSDYAVGFGNRQFARQQLWSLPFVSLLPKDWPETRDTLVRKEAFRATLSESNGLNAWTPDGIITGRVTGDLQWADSPFGKVLRTFGTSYVSFPAPQNILEMPGTVSFWVRKDEARWDRKPWPWYGELRGLLYIGSEVRETNALDLMMLKENLWTRLYDHRGWETAAIHSPSPEWDTGAWHHIAVVWNRFRLTTYVNGVEVGRETRFGLPNGGQTEMDLGWRPTNRYGQADYYDLRVFRAALPEWRIREIYNESIPIQ